MKSNLIFFIFLLFSIPAFAQGNWVSYAQSVKTAGYEGRSFRLSASVRAEVEDDSAAARLWARVDDEAGYRYYFFENMQNRPIRSREWGSFAIEGKIDSGAYKVAFGALCMYNGRFYYDDLEVEVDDGRGGWKTVFKEDFENGNSLEQGVRRWEENKYGIEETFRAETVSGNAPQGRRCLLIEGKNVPNYGVNNKAGKFAEVNGIRLYYEVYGEGQPLVVLHGNGGSIQDAAPHYPHFLAKNYQVIAVDSRAQGRSGDSETELTYELMASDVNKLLDQLGIDSTFIWGQSDGAILGLIIAKNHPDKVKKLVAFAANIVPDTTALEPPIYRWIERQVKNAKTEKERRLTRLMWQHPNIPFSELEKIQAEVLVVSGDRDMVRLEHTLQIYKHLPKAQLCVIPGATHGASWEKKDLFLQMADTFFEQKFAMPSSVEWFKE